ncbi:hypothetical protein [Mycolicibacterium mengxianglii]|uniref:hypothetical protein n=1 Tax=Mycolicibacterium mengxianglii TaxID=2736649 RepID=UPI0018D1F213|nr:hypothetical protein [Mycolicibacterium mengxianglii]
MTAKFFDVVSVKIASIYGQSVTQTHTYSQTIPITVRPGYKGTLTVRAPVRSVHR